MNGTGLGIIAILIIVLFAVAFGAQQVYSENQTLVDELRNQRSELVTTAEEAVAQKDGAQAQLAVEVEKVSKLQQKNDELATALEDGQNEIARLNAELEARNREIASLKPIPVTPGEAAAPQVVEPAAVENSALCLPVSLQDGKSQVFTALAILLGVGVLGGSSFAVYHSDQNRKYSVQMSREQMKDFIRYQRERGKQVA